MIEKNYWIERPINPKEVIKILAITMFMTGVVASGMVYLDKFLAAEKLKYSKKLKDIQTTLIRMQGPTIEQQRLKFEQEKNQFESAIKQRAFDNSRARRSMEKIESTRMSDHGSTIDHLVIDWEIQDHPTLKMDGRSLTQQGAISAAGALQSIGEVSFGGALQVTWNSEGWRFAVVESKEDKTKPKAAAPSQPAASASTPASSNKNPL